MSEEEREYLRR
jgi:hypothetical protein